VANSDKDAASVKPLTWLIQANMRDQSLRQTVETALDSIGEQHHSVTLVPFSREISEIPFSADERQIVCMGPGFVPRIAIETTWQPGIYFDPATFRWGCV